MDTKLTLRLNEDVIKRAKEYASSHQRSLSNLVESYLRALIEKDGIQTEGDIEISPFVKSLRTGIKLPPDFDEKKAYRDYLEEKYK